MKRARSIVFLAAGVWCAAIILAPILHLGPVYEFFSRICHQDPDRSWALAGTSLPVCIRCASIYFGFFIACGFARRPDFRLLKAAVIATALEFIFARLAVDSSWLRSVTGVFLGASVAPFVIAGVHDMWNKYGVVRGAV